MKESTFVIGVIKIVMNKRKEESIGFRGGRIPPLIAKCYKDNQLIKTYGNIITVKPDKKYGYFIITQKIYHHEIISIMRFADCDSIIYTDKNGVRKEITPYE